MSDMESMENNQHAAKGNPFHVPPAPPSLLPTVLQQLGLQDTSAAPTPVEHIIQALHSQEWHVRAAAVRMVGKLGSQAPLDLLLNALHDEHVSVRVTAVHALSNIGTRIPVASLVAALHDDEWQVREAAIFSLSALGENAPSEPLLAALQDNDSSVREAAQQALEHIWQISRIQDRQKTEMQPIPTQPLTPVFNFNTTKNNGMRGYMQETDFQAGEYKPVPQPQRVRPVRGRRFWTRVAISAAVLFVALNGIAWTLIVQHLRPNHPNISIVGSGPNSPVPATHPANAPTPTPPFKPTSTPSGNVGKTLYTYTCSADGIHSLAWSPDGSRLGSTCMDANARDAKTGQHVFSYGQSSGSTLSIAWSLDGKRIEASSQTVKIWDAKTGNLLLEYQPHLMLSSMVPSTHANPQAQLNPQSGGNFVYSSAWSPDGTFIASSVDGNAYGYEVQVWNTHTGVLAYKLQPNIAPTASDYIESVNWSPDGKYISLTVDGKVQVWSVATKKMVSSRSGGNSVWSPNSRLIASIGSDGNVQVWNPTTGATIHTYLGQKGSTFSVAWSPDGKRIASGGSDVQVWDATTGGNVYIYKGHGNSSYTSIISLVWSPDSRYIASGDTNEASGGHVYVWMAA